MKTTSKSFRYTTLVFLVILAISISPVIFGDTEKEVQSNQTQVATDCNAPAVFTDLEVFAKTMADPTKFSEFMALVNSPQTAQALIGCSMNTNQWGSWMESMTNPTKMMNAMALFMNPQVYTNWMAASMNPQTYQFMFAYMNPAFYSQWMAASMSPQFYQPMLAGFTPTPTQVVAE